MKSQDTYPANDEIVKITMPEILRRETLETLTEDDLRGLRVTILSGDTDEITNPSFRAAIYSALVELSTVRITRDKLVDDYRELLIK